MPLNPALHDEVITSPIERANPLNDPKQFVAQGYNTFDLTNQQVFSARFGEYTPFDVFETVPGDRHTLGTNSLSLLNTIDASLVSQVNEYHDYFYVPMRSCFPYNYEKIIANPTKGSDLPVAALPMFPVLPLLYRLITVEQPMSYEGSTAFPAVSFESIGTSADLSVPDYNMYLNTLLYVAYALSRGQLLDYLGFGLDDLTSLGSIDVISGNTYSNLLQSYIEDIFESLLGGTVSIDEGEDGVFGYIVTRKPGLRGFDLSRLPSDSDGNPIYPSYQSSYYSVSYNPRYELDSSESVINDTWTLSAFRDALYDCLEKGLFIVFDYTRGIGPANQSPYDSFAPDSLITSADLFRSYLSNFEFVNPTDETVPDTYFDGGFINPMRLIAYQQIVAEYCTNDSVDNVFTSDLWMQNMRAIMYPSSANVSSEPTFQYNGVPYEYDLFTTGAAAYSFFDSGDNIYRKLFPFVSNFFFLRRSLRYGDMFATGRPDFLSVGQLGINAESGIVDPVEVTQNLLKARYLQATNWLGSRFDAQMAGIFNSDPSDTEAKPYFISHRKVELGAQEVNGTSSDNQGKRTTNLIGTSDDNGIDIYLDDFGVVLGLVSYDVLPLYPAGVDRNFFNYDRFTMYNSMLQNVGDQDIRLVELTGDLSLSRVTFGYTTRYAQYKFPVSRAHGAFVSSSGVRQLPVSAMIYPARQFMNDGYETFHISPEFIRDRPFYFDQFFASRQTLSPAYYYHFALSVNNQHAAARRLQLIPQLLF